MSTENDVPLGEGSRRYYEQQFGDRIRKVSKGGGAGRGSGSGGSNWNGRAGVGIAVGVILVILRIVLALSRSSSSTPSYTYTPPPQVKFDEDWQKKLDKRFGNPEKDNEEKRINALLQQILEAKPADNPQPGLPQEPAQPGENGLRDEEVPLPQGLCYRIHQESLRAIPTPGRRIYQLLDDDARKLITKAAKGKALDEDEKDELLESLNDLLGRKDLYEADAFRNVTQVAPQAANMPIALYNRQLLEKSYPKQIVPVRERAMLNAPARRRWLDGARADLTEARQLYEPAKR